MSELSPPLAATETTAAKLMADCHSDNNGTLVSYYRCPPAIACLRQDTELRGAPGFFRVDRNILCYGQCSAGVQPTLNGRASVLPDAVQQIRQNGGEVRLPFDVSQVVANLQRERYVSGCSYYRRRLTSIAAVRVAYYVVRPLLPVAVRRRLQRASLRNWQNVLFPAWPMDDTVDRLMQSLLRLALQARGITEVPFIWFWPDGHRSCAIVTHDVETFVGRDFCPLLMDLDRLRGIPSSFQLIPESRYAVSDNFLRSIRDGGGELNVHDLNHDGHLYRDYAEFQSRVAKINRYGRMFGASGFRSGALYRNQDWFGDLDFQYDMSVPNAGHLEAQPGGCCTVMPYFVGDILEIPVTTTQDYFLFYILNQYSIDLWKREIETLMSANGLISLIIHPDYLVEERARKSYTALLDYLAQLRSEHALWIALPLDVNKWWRERSRMRLIATPDGWKIQGQGSGRARVAYGRLDGDRIAYRIDANPAAAWQDGIQ